MGLCVVTEKNGKKFDPTEDRTPDFQCVKLTHYHCAIRSIVAPNWLSRVGGRRRACCAHSFSANLSRRTALRISRGAKPVPTAGETHSTVMGWGTRLRRLGSVRGRSDGPLAALAAQRQCRCDTSTRYFVWRRRNAPISRRKRRTEPAPCTCRSRRPGVHGNPAARLRCRVVPAEAPTDTGAGAQTQRKIGGLPAELSLETGLYPPRLAPHTASLSRQWGPRLPGPVAPGVPAGARSA